MKDLWFKIFLVMLLLGILTSAIFIFISKKRSEEALKSNEDLASMNSAAEKLNSEETKTSTWTGKRIFISSKDFSGDLVSEAKTLLEIDFAAELAELNPGIRAADALCQNLATTAKLGGKWRALISDSKTNSRDRLKSDTKLYLTDKKTLANSKTLWDGSPDRFIDLDEYAQIQIPGRQAWTGTDISGFSQSRLPFVHCDNWTSSVGTGRAGLVSSRQVDPYFNWIAYGAGANCSEARALYCFEL